MVVLHNGSGERAVRGVHGDNLRNSRLSAIGSAIVINVRRDGNGGDSESDDSGETHFDRFS